MVRGPQLLQYKILRIIRILVLVHHYIHESPRYRLEGRMVVPQENVHVEQDIIEVHHSGLTAFLGVQLVDVAYPRLA